ncbi:MAG: TldD/PmbA family protein [Nitrososphaerales archaeon]
MDLDLAKLAVNYGLSLGVDYVEARLHRTIEVGCLLKNSTPEPTILADSFGLGVRVRYKGALAFGATNILSTQSIKDLVEEVFKRAKASINLLGEPIKFSCEEMGKGVWSAEEKEKLEDVDVQTMLNLLKELDNEIKNGFHGVSFTNRLLMVETSVEEKFYTNSEGAELRSRVPRVSISSFINATYDGRNHTITIPAGYAALGESGGWEVVKRLDPLTFFKEEGSNLAKAVKSTLNPPLEPIDVILGPDVVGLVAHESSGHPAEADRILGREGAQAGESYLKIDSLGLRIGSSEAYVSDDPTIPHSMGFYLYDEEGVKARKRRLIEGGVIKEYLHNRATANTFSTKSNAASRSVAYNREPIIRMANTYVEPGDYTFEELLEGVKLGVYIKSFMEWNIDDIRMNQRYVGLEAYLIEQGELKAGVKAPILEVTTPKFWSSVDARGKDLQFKAASCGKGDPMQGAPVWTGGPHIRLRSIKLGVR